MTTTVAIAGTVFIISWGYSRIIEEFPPGGGGYVVATKHLGPYVGAVSGWGGLAPVVAIDVTGRIGSTTSGADWVGMAIGGAGVVRSVVSGRAEPGLTATRTLSPAGDLANTAVTTKASSIIAVGQQRSEVVL